MKTEDLKDLTSFQYILNYLNNDPSIQMILVISKGHLEEVGDYMMNTKKDRLTEAKKQQIADWADDKTIEMCDPDMNAYTGQEKECVYCLRLLPYYLIEFQGKEYR